MKTIVSIYFPRFAIENHRLRWPRDAPPDDSPFALVADGPHGFILAAVTPGARKSALRRAQRLPDARAIRPDLTVAPLDPEHDARQLRELALWSRRWCPSTATDPPDALLLDVTGAAHLFGGEEAMLDDMTQRFIGLGHAARIAMTPTAGAAWALSHYGHQRLAIAHPGNVAAMLAPLCVASLRLDPDMVLLLERLGLKTVGALAAVPRLPLARRFAREAVDSNPLIRLDQAMGRLEEPVAALDADPPPRIVSRLTEPVTHLPILTVLIAEMAEALCRALELGQRGARAIRVDHFRVDGGTQTVAVETAQATRDPKHLLRLIVEKLAGLDAGFGFDAVVMTAVRHENMPIAQSHLIDGAAEGAGLPRLIDRLCAKLGHRSIRRPAVAQSHIPERSIAWQSLLSPAPAKAFPALRQQRPIRLLDRPEEISVLYATPEGAPRRFIWRRLPHIIARLEGPERIAPEWWRERSTVRLRDYYRVEDEAGRRYWLYREGVDGDGRGGLPRWYLHGLFA